MFLRTLAIALAATMASALYNPNRARDMVYLSGAAYCSQSTIEHWNCGAPCKNVTVHSPQYVYDYHLNVAGYVGQLDTGEILVSFRGTQPSSLKDWIDDLKFVKTEPYKYCSTCEVHKGFYNSWNALKSKVLNIIDSYGSGPIVITGHSLGAAIAALCAFDLKHEGYSVDSVYTFGQPRVGDTNFAKTYSGEIVNNFRVVHWHDIVPHLPLEAMGFHHVGTEIFYNEASSTYSVCNHSGEDPDCADGQLITVSISDHLHYLNLPISGMCTDPANAPVPNYWDEAPTEVTSTNGLRGSQQGRKYP